MYRSSGLISGRSQVQDEFSDGSCDERTHRIRQFLLLVNQPSRSAVCCSGEPEPIRQRLQTRGLSQREPTMLARVNEHALSIVADRDGWLIPPEPAIDVAVRPRDVGVVLHLIADAFPVPACRDAAIALDYVVSVCRGDVIVDNAVLRACPCVPKEGVLSHSFVRRLLVRSALLRLSVSSPRQICDRLSDGDNGARRAAVRRLRERAPRTEVICRVAEVAMQPHEEEACAVLGYAV